MILTEASIEISLLLPLSANLFLTTKNCPFSLFTELRLLLLIEPKFLLPNFEELEELADLAMLSCSNSSLMLGRLAGIGDQHLDINWRIIHVGEKELWGHISSLQKMTIANLWFSYDWRRLAMDVAVRRSDIQRCSSVTDRQSRVMCGKMYLNSKHRRDIWAATYIA